LYRAIVSALFKCRFGGLERGGGATCPIERSADTRFNLPIELADPIVDFKVRFCIGRLLRPFLYTDFGFKFRFLYRPIVSDQFEANCIASSASNIFWLFL
jgi:hypothetical protein